tara:strand:+ start:217 stop:357 length:141 start_codon:yes stop_codon:yes gene_type:complete
MKQKMIDIDDIVQSSIDPLLWEKLPAIKKLNVLQKLTEIEKIIHSQ